MNLADTARLKARSGKTIYVKWIMDFFKHVAQGWSRIIAEIKQIIKNAWDVLKSNKALMDKAINKKHRPRFKLDLMRNKMHHQVMCRKPVLIRKIIR